VHIEVFLYDKTTEYLESIMGCLLMRNPSGFRWVYIRVQVLQTWGPEQFLLDLSLGLKIGPKLED
jgi:hypothetical protein